LEEVNSTNYMNCSIANIPHIFNGKITNNSAGLKYNNAIKLERKFQMNHRKSYPFIQSIGSFFVKPEFSTIVIWKIKENAED
jgi:hypothetical protein